MHTFDNATLRVRQRCLQLQPRRPRMAAAAELLGEFGDIHLTFGSQAHANRAEIAWFDDQDGYFDTLDHQRNIDEVLCVIDLCIRLL